MIREMTPPPPLQHVTIKDPLFEQFTHFDPYLHPNSVEYRQTLFYVEFRPTYMYYM